MYCITFRIANKTVGNKSYNERRNLLVANATAEDLGYWDETTSFNVVGSALSTSQFATRLCKGLSAADDMVFVFDPEDMSAYYFGPVEYRDVLVSFFSKAKKLG